MTQSNSHIYLHLYFNNNPPSADEHVPGVPRGATNRAGSSDKLHTAGEFAVTATEEFGWRVPHCDRRLLSHTQQSIGVPPQGPRVQTNNMSTKTDSEHW